MERTRQLGLLALLALAPVAYFLVGTGERWVALSLVSVVIIAGSLVLMLGPSPEPT